MPMTTWPRIHSGPKVHCTGSNACKAWSIWLALALSVSCSCRRKSWPKTNETICQKCAISPPRPTPQKKRMTCLYKCAVVPKPELKAHFRGDSLTNPVLNPFWRADQSGWNVVFNGFFHGFSPTFNFFKSLSFCVDRVWIWWTMLSIDWTHPAGPGRGWLPQLLIFRSRKKSGPTGRCHFLGEKHVEFWHNFKVFVLRNQNCGGKVLRYLYSERMRKAHIHIMYIWI